MKIFVQDGFIRDSKDKLIEEYGYVTCGCGNPALKVTAFLDDGKYCSNNYRCRCGNEITICRVLIGGEYGN